MEMLGTASLRRHPALSLVFESGEIVSRRARPRPRPPPRCVLQVVTCCDNGSAGSGSAPKRRADDIPKLEPFSKSRMEWLLEERSFIQRTEDDLTEYCTTLEGDDSYSCWMAYFELKDLEKELPKDDVERILLLGGGLSCLIDRIHRITAIEEKSRALRAKAKAQPPPPPPPPPAEAKPPPAKAEREKERPFRVPDGIPPTEEELEEAERVRMQESPYIRFLRHMGKRCSSYKERPDVEYD